MTDEDICGYEGTTTGEPCRHPAGSCPVPTHTADTDVETDGGNRGRPTKFNDKRAQQAIEAARDGLSKAGCARAAGVSHTTIDNWLDNNPTFESRDGDTAEFFAAFTRARSRGERVLVEDGLRDPDTDSSMAKFLLSTSFGYVKTEKREVEHSGDGGGPLEVVIGGDRE